MVPCHHFQPPLIPMKISEESRPAQSEAILTVAIYAALSDGGKTDDERDCLRSLAGELGVGDISAMGRGVLLGKTSLDSAIGQLQDPADKQLAYEMALAVCEVSGNVSAGEREFLDGLKDRLGLAVDESSSVEQEVHAVVTAAPVPAEPPAIPATSDNGPMILKYAILNGALELLPESLATMAIIPLQMKMVYRIGNSHGVQLDSGHIREFLATAGLGLGSQMIEGFARKIFGKLGKSVGGKLVGRVANQAAGSAMSFASTFAIGHVADNYYRGGRKLDMAALREMFTPLQQQALDLHSRYLPEIQERARTLDTPAILDLARGKGQP